MAIAKYKLYIFTILTFCEKIKINHFVLRININCISRNRLKNPKQHLVKNGATLSVNFSLNQCFSIGWHSVVHCAYLITWDRKLMKFHSVADSFIKHFPYWIFVIFLHIPLIMLLCFTHCVRHCVVNCFKQYILKTKSVPPKHFWEA